MVSRVDPAGVADARFLREAVESASPEDPPAEFAGGHVTIGTAVHRGDASEAGEVMRAHLRAVFQDVERIRHSSPPTRRDVVVRE